MTRRRVKVRDKIMLSIFHCLLMHVSYCCIKLSHSVFFFWSPASLPKVATLFSTTVSCCCCPAHWDVLRGMSCQKFLRDCNIFPFARKTFFIFKIWGEAELADNHKTVAVFLPLLFPAPPGAINKSREMCEAHLQRDSPEWPEFWADKDINSCKWSVLLICMQLQCRDQGKFKAIHCCWIPLRLGKKKI